MILVPVEDDIFNKKLLHSYENDCFIAKSFIDLLSQIEVNETEYVMKLDFSNDQYISYSSYIFQTFLSGYVVSFNSRTDLSLLFFDRRNIKYQKNRLTINDVFDQLHMNDEKEEVIKTKILELFELKRILGFFK